MKKILVLSASLFLFACSTQQSQVSQVPLDMKTVEQYQAKVYSGNTVPASQRKEVAPVVQHPMDASDSRPQSRQVQARVQPRVILAPSIGYYRGYRHGHWYW